MNCLYRLLCFLACAALCCAACSLRRTDAGPGSAAPEFMTVKVVPAVFSNVGRELFSFGSLNFVNKADISSPVEGVVKAMYAEEGDWVRQGELLAEIENTQLEIRAARAESSLSEANASLSLAKANYREGLLQVEARLIAIEKLELIRVQKKLEIENLEKVLIGKEELLSLDGITEEQVTNLRLSLGAARTEYANIGKDLEINRIGLRDEDIRSLGYEVPNGPAQRLTILKELSCLTLQAKVDVAQAELQAAVQELKAVNLLLDELKIISPAGGIIGARYLETGERLAAGTKFFTVIRGDCLYAVFPVREQDALLVKKGQEVMVTLPALGGGDRYAKVKLISPMLDPQTGSIMVKAELDNPDFSLKPGMFARVRLVYGEPESRMFLPLSALLARVGGEGEVFTSAGGRIFRRPVWLGSESDGMVEILNGVAEGDLVVDSPPPLLREGDIVHVE